MGKLTEDVHHPDNKIQQKPTKKTMIKKKKMKITYISSPVMVSATTTSEFRAIVQELTGKDSDFVVLSPRDNEEGPVLSRESGVTANLPASRVGYAPSDGRSNSLNVEEANDLHNNSVAVNALGFNESFTWRESSEGIGRV